MLALIASMAFGVEMMRARVELDGASLVALVGETSTHLAVLDPLGRTRFWYTSTPAATVVGDVAKRELVVAPPEPDEPGIWRAVLAGERSDVPGVHVHPGGISVDGEWVSLTRGEDGLPSTLSWKSPEGRTVVARFQGWERVDLPALSVAPPAGFSVRSVRSVVAMAMPSTWAAWHARLPIAPAKRAQTASPTQEIPQP